VVSCFPQEVSLRLLNMTWYLFEFYVILFSTEGELGNFKTWLDTCWIFYLISLSIEGEPGGHNIWLIVCWVLYMASFLIGSESKALRTSLDICWIFMGPFFLQSVSLRLSKPNLLFADFYEILFPTEGESKTKTQFDIFRILYDLISNREWVWDSQNQIWYSLNFYIIYF